jgi:hypothetical protein
MVQRLWSVHRPDCPFAEKYATRFAVQVHPECTQRPGGFLPAFEVMLPDCA